MVLGWIIQQNINGETNRDAEGTAGLDGSNHYDAIL